MARRRWHASVILAAGLMSATGAIPAAGVEPDHEIRLLSQRFTPPAGVPETARQAIGRRAEELRARGKERLHLLVQLHELPSPAGRQELARQGLDLGAFVPGSAFIAAVPVGRAVAALARPEVRWATLWEARHKLHPRVAAGDWAPWARDPARPEMVATMLLLHHDVPLAAGPALAAKVGGVAMPAVEGLHGMTVWLPQTRVAELAAEEEVLWIEEAPPPLTPTNDGVRSGLRANGLAEAPYNLDGSGVRLFVFDSGSVRGTHQTFDPGTGSRVTVIDGQPVSNHTTHVAGTAAGDGSGSAGGRGRGVAPGVSVLSAAYQQVGGSMFFWDNAGDIEADYANARTVHGADLGTNSLGSNTAGNGFPCEREGDYGVASSLIDGIVHGTNAAVGSPVLMTWSAGNERSSGNPQGRCGSNYGTTPPPACAKNPIHVGAVNSDGLSMTTFSSWGPCDDGSLKPTIVAPGCETGLVTGETFVYSSTATSNSSYGGNCGTSMATPAVAGAAALLVEAWREQGHGGPTDRPLPALVKALLIHTARDLGPEGPDYIYGYGAVDAQAAIDLLRGNDSFSRGWITGTVGQGAIQEHYINGPWEDLDEAKVTLVWDDPAAAPFAAEALVNDLTLEYSNYFNSYQPWVLAPASPHLPATTGVDSRNNVEQIVVRDAPMSDTLMRVIGTRVPRGPQSYALVFSFKPAVVDKTACTVTSSTFETGTDGWTLSGAAHTLAPASGHGAKSVRLGGAVDTLHQATRPVVVPIEARAELAFWWYMTTEESLDIFGFGFDPFTAEIRNASGAVLAVVDLRNDGWPQGRWMQQRIDLTPWAGQTVTIAFTATNDVEAPTTFWIDDVTVTSCPKICNPGGSTAPVSVIPVDDPPVAVADAATVTEDSRANAINVLANDTDPDGGPISITSVTQPANGTVAITGCGTGLIYAPNPNYCSDSGTPDTFTYTLTPGDSTATVTVTAICDDDAPAAVADAATVTEDSASNPINVLANDTDPDGGLISIASVTQPANGTVVITGGGTDLTYQPNANYCNSFSGTPDTFTYTLTPGGSTATVSVTVTCVDDPPTAVADAATVNEDSGATAVPVLANDTDPDGGAISITSGTQPANGTVVITGGGTGLIYAPNANYCNSVSGIPDTFTYTLTPGGSTATVSVTVTCVPDPPVADNDTFDFIGNTELRVDLAAASTPHALETTPSTFGVLDGDSDPVENNAISVTGIVGCADVTAPFVCALPGVGTVTMESNGRFSFVPEPGDAGATETFQYIVTANGVPAPASTTATVTLTRFERVWYVKNDAPAGGNGTSSSPFNSITPANLSDNDGDGDLTDDLDSAGDYIFVYFGTGTSANQSGGLVLENGQHLIGQHAGLSLNANLNGNGAPTSLVVAAPGSRPLLDDTVIDAFEGVSARNVVPAEIVGMNLAGNVNGIDWTTTAAFAGTGTFVIRDNVVRSAANEGVDINLAGTGATRLAFHDNNLTATGTGLDIQETGTGTLTITAFDDNVVSGNTGGSGILVSNAVFDSVPGGGLDTVNGGTTVIGASGNGVGGAGMVLSNVQGDLHFTGNLNIFADGGAGLSASGTGAGFQFRVNSGGAPTGIVEATIGPAVNANTVGLDLRLTSLRSTNSATTGVSLTNVTGTFSGESGSSITNATGTDFAISGGTAAVTYKGTITDDLGQIVSVANATAGTKSFQGAITDGDDGDGNGVSLSSNTGATIRFSGGLVLSTGGNPAFAATGGGTVEVCDENPCNPGATGGTVNKLTTTTGTALNVASTTIGSNKLELRSISAGTVASGPSNGIVLNNTGSSGGLTVSGTGGAGSGGTIQKTTSHGVSLTSTLSPSFTSMTIKDTGGSGVKGTQVTSFTFNNGSIDNSGTGLGTDESNIAFNTSAAGTERNLSGTVTITGNTLSNAYYHGIDILNFNGTANDITISGNTLTSATTTASSKGSGIRLQALGSATTVANITKATLSNNVISRFPSGNGILTNCGNANTTGTGGSCGTPGSAANVITITGNTIAGQASPDQMGSNAIAVALTGGNGASRSQANFDVSSNGTPANPLTNFKGTGVACSVFGMSTATCTVSNNVMVANNLVASRCISVRVDRTIGPGDTPDLTATINNNQISACDGNGIFTGALNSNGTARIKIQNNTVAAPLSGFQPGIRIDSGTPSAAGTNTTVCLNLSGNTSAGSEGTQGIGLRKVGTASATNAFGVNGMAATSSPGVETYINGLNPAGSGTLLISATSGFTSCSLP